MTLSYRFSAPGWAWLLTAALALLFLRLGLWQVNRAEEKEAMISAYQQAAKSAPADVSAMLQAGSLRYGQGVVLEGRFELQRGLLLDNQVRGGQAGYHVWTPMRLAGGQLLLVDRGWIAMNPDRRILPQFDTPREATVRGVWQPLPRPGLRIGENECSQGPWPRVVQYPRFEELVCILGPGVLDGVLWLDPDDPHGFSREWAISELPPERHYGYALQWFALAITLFVLFVVVNLRRNPVA